ncbi:MAG: M13 family metallopeptidase [Bacteroidaceae bacterium]|nr:M13 family metallopeptidase [Bacteroidaceae bacterium]
MKRITIFAMTMAMCMAGCKEKDNTAGISLDNMNQSVKPGDNFYQYAAGGWMASHPLTDEYSSFGSFDELAELNRQQLKDLIDGIVSADNVKGTNAQKIADLYNLVMDTTRRNQEGLEPIKPVLARINAISERSQLLPEMVELDPYGVAGYFGVGIGPDMMDSRTNIVSIGQGGLSLGSKEYYFDQDEQTAAIREAFRKHIVRMFMLVGYDEPVATAKMEAIWAIEMRIAEKSYDNVQQRDPMANYHKMSIDQLKSDFSGIDWDMFFNKVGLVGVDTVDVGQPEPIHEVEKILAEVSVEDQKSLMEWQVIDASASKLTTELDEANFDFYGRTMSGQQEQKPLWKRATSSVSGTLGEAIGELYAEKYFPAAAKERMVQLVKNLQVALGQRIDEQEWMSPETKAVAHEKLDAFYVKIGYPDKWRDYSGLVIDPSKTLYENSVEISKFFWNDMVARKYKKPVDITEWHMTPQTVNAYYNPTTNEICFPAGILQPPFFDMNADDAYNYGAIGVVIGHEMTHGFDDQGRQFDKNGNLTDWWAEGDADKFQERAQVIVDHFSGIEVLPGINANGSLTLGENIADHGGLMVSFQAFQNATAGSEKEVKLGFTPEQRFFLSYAGIWAENNRDEYALQLTKSDPHSLGKNRVNGTLPHIDAWYDAFGVQPDDSLYLSPEKRARIW